MLWFQLFKAAVNVIIALTALAIAVLYMWAFSTIIGEFSWGNYNAYFIWGVAIPALLLPVLITCGVLSFIINCLKNWKFVWLIMFAFIIMTPLYLGIDRPEVTTGRWSGFFIGLLGTGFFVRETFVSFIQFRNKLSRTEGKTTEVNP